MDLDCSYSNSHPTIALVAATRWPAASAVNASWWILLAKPAQTAVQLAKSSSWMACALRPSPAPHHESVGPGVRRAAAIDASRLRSADVDREKFALIGYLLGGFQPRIRGRDIVARQQGRRSTMSRIGTFLPFPTRVH
jgi:hypothetical protein